VIFSVILMSNLFLFASSQNRTVFYSQSDASSLLADEAGVLTGAAATNILMEAQSVLSAGPLDCSTAAEQVANKLGSLNDTQRSGPLTVWVSALQVPGKDALDNLSMVRPFDGSLSDELSMSLHASAVSDRPIGGVMIDRIVSHLVHLPVRWASELRDCVDVVSSISASVSASKVSNCTANIVGPLMEAAGAGPSSLALADGFDLGYSYSISSQTPCTVSFGVRLEQTDIVGPSGTFSVLLAWKGVAAFA
jgi:hypothetical protein